MDVVNNYLKLEDRDLLFTIRTLFVLAEASLHKMLGSSR